MSNVELQGASLSGAHLQGALLDSALLQGASLDSALLQGASLSPAQLAGASLSGAQLQGAWFDRANLQGASLRDAELDGASFRIASVWLTDTRSQAKQTADPVTGRGARTAFSSPVQCKEDGCTIQQLKQLVSQTVPEGSLRDDALRRIDEQLGESAQKNENELKKAWTWSDADASGPSDLAFDSRLLKQMRAVGCAAEGAPYVIQTLLFRIEDRRLDSIRLALAKFFLDQDHCAGAFALSPADRARLKTILESASP